MDGKPAQPHHYWVYLVVIVGTILTLMYGLGYLISVPYKGFLPEVPDGMISQVFVPEAGGDSLLPGDRFIEAGSQTWQDFIDHPTTVLMDWAKPGEIIPIVVERDGTRLEINWYFPGLNQEELVYRLLQPWEVPLIMLVGAIGCLLFARPKSHTWTRLVLFFTILSVWLAAGIVSHTQIYLSRYAAHILVWILLAVAIDFHWNFPVPLKQLPGYAGWLLYGICMLAAVIELLAGLALPALYIGVLLLALSILVLLIAHAVKHKEHRGEIQLLLGGILLAFIPSVLFSLLDSSQSDTGFLYVPVLLVYSILPVTYIYSIYYHRLGGLELRANPAIVGLIYGLLLFVFVLLVGVLLQSIRIPENATMLTLVFLFVLVGISSPFLYPKFSFWVHRKVFGIALPSVSVFESSAARIIASLDREHLAATLGGQLFPSLMIRQAALLGLEPVGSGTTYRQIHLILQMNLLDEDLPQLEDIPALIETAARTQPARVGGEAFSWVRVVFPLQVEARMVGLCLLGRRDPDDYYSPSEIPTLRALMDQTALALLNIEQSENLRALYQANIDRQEAEQLRLARLLHDEVLGQMALLAQYADPARMDSKFTRAYQISVDYIRDIIAGLRPATLNFGLPVALEELVFEHNSKKPAQESYPEFVFDVTADAVRYPADVELHLYRIIQQALSNALVHAQAKTIALQGSLEADCIRLLVVDDGIGFPPHTNMEISGLLASKHFGLAGMHERAAIIGASLRINSQTGRGTGIQIDWSNHRQYSKKEME